MGQDCLWGLVYMNDKYIDFKRFELECATPVYVGSGKTLKTYEYIYNKNNQGVLFLNEQKWISFLSRHKLMEAYAEYVSNTAQKLGSRDKYRYRNENLLEWLLKRNISENEISDVALRHSFAGLSVMQKDGGGGALNDVACCMAAPDGRPYIPGSTIKGNLATAIMFRLLQKNQKLKEKYWSIIKERNQKNQENGLRAKASNGKGTLENEMMQELLGKLDIEKGNFGVKSVMRGLLISDALCADDVTTEVLMKMDANVAANLNKYNAQNEEHGVALYRECIPSETKLNFTISLDKRLMGEIGFNTIEDVLDASRDFMEFNYDLQKSVFGRYYGDSLMGLKNADLWLGGGGGFFSKTLVYALAPSVEEAKKVAARHLDLVFKNRHKHFATDKKLAPRALKIAYEDQSATLMGLCNLREVK